MWRRGGQAFGVGCRHEFSSAVPPPSSTPRFRLTATTVAGHFKYRCERRFRWTAVPRPVRGREGTIGAGVPRPPDQAKRPGIAELMAGGEAFELGHVEALAETHGDAFVWAGRVFDASKGRDGVGVLPVGRLIEALRAPDGVRFVAQPELGYAERDDAGRPRVLSPDEAAFNERLGAAFCERFGLDPARVELGLSRPDLLEFVPCDGDAADPRPRIRVWDFKSSREPRHDHFVQVAWYTFLLETLLEIEGIGAVHVDVETGAVRTHRRVRGISGMMEPADPAFDLTPYRRTVEGFLRTRCQALLALGPREAHWHVQAACLACEYADPCRTAADLSRDVSRVPYLSSEARRALVAGGIATEDALAAFADAVEAGEPEACARAERLAGDGHDLSVHLPRYLAAAQALDDAARVEDAFARERGAAPRRYETDRRIAEAGVGVWLDRPTLLMPSSERVRIVVAAEQDAVSHRCYALGFRLFRWDAETGAAPDEAVFVSERGPSDAHPDGDEGEILDRFLVALFAHLDGFDAHNRAVDAEKTDERSALDVARTAYRAAEAVHKSAVAAHKAAAKDKALDAAKKAAHAEKQTASAALREARQAWERVCRPQRVSVQALRLRPARPAHPPRGRRAAPLRPDRLRRALRAPAQPRPPRPADVAAARPRRLQIAPDHRRPAGAAPHRRAPGAVSRTTSKPSRRACARAAATARSAASPSTLPTASTGTRRTRSPSSASTTCGRARRSSTPTSARRSARSSAPTAPRARA